MAEQINKINEERLKKFREMGMPVPLPESIEYTRNPGAGQQAMASMKNLNADPDKLRKLEAIKNGLNRNEFKDILEKAEPKPINGFKPLQPKNKHGQNTLKSEIVVPIKDFAPSDNAELRALETMLSEDDSRGAYSQPIQPNDGRTSSRMIQEDVNDDPYGSNFLQKLKSKRTSSPGVSIQSSTGNIGLKVMQPVAPNFRQSTPGLSDIELENKILEIATYVATDISKNMIKKVISEYSKDGSGMIIESKNVKKAELVGNGVVKIAGKIYKLVPVKDKA